MIDAGEAFDVHLETHIVPAMLHSYKL
jgi:hypothetical protein